MLKDSYKLFINDAKRLPGFKIGTKEDYDDIEQLANTYVKYEKLNDKDMMSSCISALMVRYWYMVPFIYDKTKSLKIDIEDVVGILYDALMKAFKYKSWLDKSKGVSKEKHGAEKCINRCIDSARQGAFQQSNTDSRKLNYMTFSVEESVELFGDASECLFVEDKDEMSAIKDLVEYKLKLKDLVSALVIDSICFNDCFNKAGFNLSRVVSGLYQKDYIQSFKFRYKLDSDICDRLDALVKNKRQTLNTLVQKSLINLQKDREVINNAFGCC